MVRNSSWIKLFLVLVMVMLSAVSLTSAHPILAPNKETSDEEEYTVRIERSPDGSRLTGTGSKIRMYIREKYLQIFTDGNVNATDDEDSVYNILQRTSVSPGQVKIQGVATCMFLCMDVCGLLYSTREAHDDCVFQESLEKDYYNVYSSRKYSSPERTLYMAVAKNGTPRKVEVKGNGTLGKWSSAAAVLPQPVDQQSLQDLEDRILMPQLATNRRFRHHHMCPSSHHAKLTISKKCRNRLEKKKKPPKKKSVDEDYEDSSSTNRKNNKHDHEPDEEN